MTLVIFGASPYEQGVWGFSKVFKGMCPLGEWGTKDKQIYYQAESLVMNLCRLECGERLFPDRR